MKKYLWILFVVVTFSRVCGESTPAWSAAITLQRIEEAKDVEGHWALASDWDGDMGMALELRGGKYRYWFRSDVHSRNEPKYPVTGKYVIEGGILVLMNAEKIYDSRWFLVSDAGRTGLFAASDFETIVGRKEAPHERMLFRIDDEIAKKSWPIYNELK